MGGTAVQPSLVAKCDGMFERGQKLGVGELKQDEVSSLGVGDIGQLRPVASAPVSAYPVPEARAQSLVERVALLDISDQGARVR
jgi:hypothetical protein